MGAATKAFTERELVEGMKAGDEKVFKELYRMYSLTLLNIIDRIIHDDTAKFDILQDVMAKIWKHGNAYDRTKGSLFTWMLNVTRNHTIDVIRSKQYRNHLKNIGINEVRGIYSMFSTDKIDMKNLVNQLPEKNRVVIDMVYFNGFTHMEASVELRIPLGTVKTRIAMGLMELKKLFNYYRPYYLNDKAEPIFPNSG